MSSPEGSTVTFRRASPDLRRGPIERFARKLQMEVAHGRAFDCLISGDAELRRLNRDFRGQDYATDVLSFPSGVGLPACLGQRPVPLGDIAISLPRARAQAREFGHKPEQEIRILMLHGLLHLLGMDHESDRGRMARAEKRWRARMRLPHGLIERGLIERGLSERGLIKRVQP
jgi:probable rRNA maturation factor